MASQLKEQVLILVICACVAASPRWAFSQKRYEGLPNDLCRTLNRLGEEPSGEAAKRPATEIRR